MTRTQSTMLKVAAALWVVWGLVHALAGVLTMTGDAAAGFQAIADAVDPASLAGPFPEAVGAVLRQHAWNLLWFGCATVAGAVFIWRGSMTAVWVTAMIGGLADVGYFVFLDLAGHVAFFPGTVMTLISGMAILLSGLVWFGRRGAADPATA